MSKKVYIRQKIKSIQTTKKITHALRLVSMSLYSKLENQSKFFKIYADGLSETFESLLKYKPDWKSPALQMWQKPDACQIWIIVGTTKGLCGSLNSNLFRYLSNEIATQNGCDIKFMTIGQRAYNFVHDTLNGEILYSYNDFNSNNYNLITSDLLTKMNDLKVCFSSVTVYFNEPRSFFIQKPSKFKLLPISEEIFHRSRKACNEGKHANVRDMIWEQDSSVILEFVLIRFIKSQISYALLQSLISEYSARFIAMDSSTNNAEKFLEKLVLQYNKIRQGSITREISELSASFADKI